MLDGAGRRAPAASRCAQEYQAFGRGQPSGSDGGCRSGVLWNDDGLTADLWTARASLRYARWARTRRPAGITNRLAHGAAAYGVHRRAGSPRLAISTANLPPGAWGRSDHGVAVCVTSEHGVVVPRPDWCRDSRPPLVWFGHDGPGVELERPVAHASRSEQNGGG